MTDAEPIIRPNFSGTPAIRGSRITIFHVMDHYLAERPVEWVAKFYDIAYEDAAAAYEYIAANESDVRRRYAAIVERERELAIKSHTPELEAKFAKSHEKLLKLKAELERRRAEKESRDARAVE